MNNFEDLLVTIAKTRKDMERRFMTFQIAIVKKIVKIPTAWSYNQLHKHFLIRYQ